MLPHCPTRKSRTLWWKACKAALIHDFVAQLPKGYKTWIGERGASLSGGQKQRLVIARTIISNPKVLLLDEATSALDPSAEKMVQAALNNVAKGRTVIIVAHRLSTVQDSHNIIVLGKGGRVLEQGTHSSLVNLGGAYASLVRAQDLGEKFLSSALNTASEWVVKAALDQAAEGRTTVAVAHRLSTIRDAHTIFVFVNVRGAIVEAGCVS
ncbi:hypothetical protein E4U61_004669 [Claviceps capensis]|nr:hypothetical protein E4U61_004669 [Claviceps capensis]